VADLLRQVRLYSRGDRQIYFYLDGVQLPLQLDASNLIGAIPLANLDGNDQSFIFDGGIF
jgi:hypothetical protein